MRARSQTPITEVHARTLARTHALARTHRHAPIGYIYIYTRSKHHTTAIAGGVASGAPLTTPSDPSVRLKASYDDWVAKRRVST
jgi:hypothetical protein